MEEFFDEDAPDARWQLITLLVAEGQSPSRRNEDEWLRKGVRYLKRFQTPSIEEKRRLKDDYPNIYKAHQLYRQEEGTKWILEAALLTSVDDETVANYIGQSVEVVREYTSLFFDIKPRLKHEGYILNRILMPALNRGMHQRDFDFLFKTLSYCCGWEHFKAFISQGALPREMERYFQQSFRTGLLKAGFLATKRLDINNFNAVPVMDLTLRLLELEKEAASVGDNDKAEKLIGALLNECKLAIIPSKTPLSIIEPRADELITGVQRLKYGEHIPVIQGKEA